jgi:hypothetical protein
MQSARDDVILAQLLRLSEDMMHLRGDNAELRGNFNQLIQRVASLEANSSALASTIIMGQHALPIATSSSNDDSTVNFSTPLAPSAFSPTLNNQDHAPSQVSTPSPMSFNDMVSITRPDLFRAGSIDADIYPESNSHPTRQPSPVIDVPSSTLPSAPSFDNIARSNESRQLDPNFSINQTIPDDVLNAHFDEIIRIAQLMVNSRTDFLKSHPTIATIVKDNLSRAQAVKAARESTSRLVATAADTQTEIPPMPSRSLTAQRPRRPASRDSSPKRVAFVPDEADFDIISDDIDDAVRAETRISPPRNATFRSKHEDSKDSSPDSHQLTRSFVSMSVEKVKAPRLKAFNGTALCHFLDAYKEYLTARPDGTKPTPIRSCVEYDVMAELEAMMHVYDSSISIDWADVTVLDKQLRALAKFTWYRFVVHDLSSMRINADFKPSDPKQLEVITKQLSSMQTMIRVLRYSGLPSDVYLGEIGRKLPDTLVMAAYASHQCRHPTSDVRQSTAVHTKIAMCQGYLHQQLPESAQTLNSAATSTIPPAVSPASPPAPASQPAPVPQLAPAYFPPGYPSTPAVYPPYFPAYTPPGQVPHMYMQQPWYQDFFPHHGPYDAPMMPAQVARRMAPLPDKHPRYQDQPARPAPIADSRPAPTQTHEREVTQAPKQGPPHFPQAPRRFDRSIIPTRTPIRVNQAIAAPVTTSDEGYDATDHGPSIPDGYDDYNSGTYEFGATGPEDQQ